MVDHFKFFLRKIEGLLNKINVLVFHLTMFPIGPNYRLNANPEYLIYIKSFNPDESDMKKICHVSDLHFTKCKSINYQYY